MIVSRSGIEGDARVADIVAAHPECGRILKEARIDFCCQGQQTLAAACTRAGLDLGAVVASLDAEVEARAGTTPREPWAAKVSIPSLIALIIERHHGWLRESLPWIESMALKVSRVHGAHDPRLVELGEVVSSLAAMLLPHLDDEERRLFPALMALSTPRDVILAGLADMEVEHREVGALLGRTRSLTDDFAPPEWACGTYRALLAELAHLEDDVMKHVHLENHVLAAKVRAEVGA